MRITQRDGAESSSCLRNDGRPLGDRDSSFVTHTERGEPRKGRRDALYLATECATLVRRDAPYLTASSRHDNVSTLLIAEPAERDASIDNDTNLIVCLPFGLWGCVRASVPASPTVRIQY